MLFHSTRGGDKDKDFASILMQGLADDGGLFMPDYWPQVDLEKIKGLQSFVEVAKEIVPLFTASSFTQEETIKIVENTWHDFEHQDLVGIQTIENICRCSKSNYCTERSYNCTSNDTGSFP